MRFRYSQGLKNQIRTWEAWTFLEGQLSFRQLPNHDSSFLSLAIGSQTFKNAEHSYSITKKLILILETLKENSSFIDWNAMQSTKSSSC